MILHAQEASHGPVYLWHLGPSTRYAAPMLPALLVKAPQWLFFLRA
jgi:hypothetical protein